ncbi:MAG: deoxyribodipyrimidine photo-lyase [Candidatus Eremiobacteraeota bacterium]|nr:deoxyribodipyrimidine photo-lyase [Candidatus Eremiobacteraeota bacterium]
MKVHESRETSIVWFRRDLRLNDHVALERAARGSERVICVFVLDPELLRGGEIGAPIVSFFFDALAELRATLRERGSDLALLEGDFLDELGALAERTGATALYYNVDYEPAARKRDARVAAGLTERGVRVESSLDHVYFGADEILKSDGAPYTVYTPYKRRWLERHESEPRPPVDSAAALAGKFATWAAIGKTRDVPKPEEFGHARSAHYARGGERHAREILDGFIAEHVGQYAATRNLPAIPGTSHLSPHLRAGTIGIRTCVFAALDARRAARGARATGIDTWLGELIWRDFYQQIYSNFPQVAREPFIAAAKGLKYRASDRDFKAWCAGRTGYPIVDAAMTQLNTYGWMHNRLRMIVASFLTKDLLLDYRLGEAYFARHLIDHDAAANNGGWQWSSSTGTDAAPYFRVFNPVLQSEKFDPDGAFIRQMLPALAELSGKSLHAPWTMPPLEAESKGFRLGRDYPEPIVDHAAARLRALAAYAPVLGKKTRDEHT